MATVTANGVRLFYREYGQGTPIVLVHGTGSSALVWELTASQLARFGRVIVYDRRGCSRSERPVPYIATSVSEQTDDLADLLVRLAATPAIVIGRSYGGTIALELAVRFPDRVAALVLLEPVVLALSETATQWSQALRERVLSVAETDMSRVGEAFERVVLGDDGWRALPGPIQAMYEGNGAAIKAELQGGGSLSVPPATYATIRQPVLLVTGRDSPPAFREMTATLARTLPSARTVVVAGGHEINPDHAHLLGFLTEHTQTRKSHDP